MYVVTKATNDLILQLGNILDRTKETLKGKKAKKENSLSKRFLSSSLTGQ